MNNLSPLGLTKSLNDCANCAIQNWSRLSFKMPTLSPLNDLNGLQSAYHLIQHQVAWTSGWISITEAAKSFIMPWDMPRWLFIGAAHRIEITSTPGEALKCDFRVTQVRRGGLRAKSAYYSNLRSPVVLLKLLPTSDCCKALTRAAPPRSACIHSLKLRCPSVCRPIGTHASGRYCPCEPLTLYYDDVSHLHKVWIHANCSCEKNLRAIDFLRFNVTQHTVAEFCKKRPPGIYTDFSAHCQREVSWC